MAGATSLLATCSERKERQALPTRTLSTHVSFSTCTDTATCCVLLDAATRSRAAAARDAVMDGYDRRRSEEGASVCVSRTLLRRVDDLSRVCLHRHQGGQDRASRNNSQAHPGGDAKELDQKVPHRWVSAQHEQLRGTAGASATTPATGVAAATARALMSARPRAAASAKRQRGQAGAGRVGGGACGGVDPVSALLTPIGIIARPPVHFTGLIFAGDWLTHIARPPALSSLLRAPSLPRSLAPSLPRSLAPSSLHPSPPRPSSRLSLATGLVFGGGRPSRCCLLPGV